MISNWDRDIKGVPMIKSVNEGHSRLIRTLTISSSATESGVNVARPNTYGKQ